MNQKKHLNAIAALEASKDAEPGDAWGNYDFCLNIDCAKCYGPGGCYCNDTVFKVREALQSGLDAYHKRKAEKAERRAIEAANSPDLQTITIPRDPAVWDAKKGPYPVMMKHEDGPNVFRINEDPGNGWLPATLSEVLPLIFDGPRQFADEARRQGWKR